MKAGIQVDLGVLENEAQDLNQPYLKRVATGIPWVIAKWAMTIDGRIATRAGESQWITNAQSRHQVHLLRSRVDAVIVGMGTVSDDDPMLTARLAEEADLPPRIATRVVFCRNRLPALKTRLVKTAGEFPTLLFVGPTIQPAETKPLEDRGVVVTRLLQSDASEMIREGLVHLGQRGMTNVMVEGGGELLGSFRESLDECHVYLGPQAFWWSDSARSGGGARELLRLRRLRV